MIALFISAFLTGALGSVHCIGMCGPLALSLPVKGDSRHARLLSTLLYNSGRVVTYAVLGAVCGTLGATFALFGYQQWLSVFLGVLILFFLFLPGMGDVLKKSGFFSGYFDGLRRYLGKLFTKKNYRSLLFIGLLNGLLPCGLVYIGIAGAVATASVLKSSFFMAAFGLGTLPVMWGVSFFGSYISFQARQKIRAAYPYVMALMACLLIVRGLGLEIPYISPVHVSHTTSAIGCHN